jgi:hypothetical protein
MTDLNNNDYKTILEYYKKPIPKSNRLLKMEAEKILVSKLCSCIKKIDTTNEAKSIGICTKSVINRKGYHRGKFTCKSKPSIQIKKNITKKNITKKNIKYSSIVYAKK